MRSPGDEQLRGGRDDECQSLAMVVHMTAAPYGCGRDLYIFMRPEMVKGKVKNGYDLVDST